MSIKKAWIACFLISVSAIADQTFTGQTNFQNAAGREVMVDDNDGDSTLTFHDSGDAWYSMGIDYSDGRRFKLNYGGEVGDSNHFTMDRYGDVGIGTTSPLSKLHVANGYVMSGSVNATQGALQFAGNYSGSNVLNTYGSQYSSAATSIGYAVKQKTGSQGFVSSAANSNFVKGMVLVDNEFEFLNGGASMVPLGDDVSLTSRFIIRGSGNVGIGTTTPSRKLDVNGTIRSKEVIVESTGWPDYVFEDGYELPSLEEVASHIDSKGHLPGVQPASTVNEDGQSLGAMQRQMMQKIEELTLYVIDLKKENDELKAKVEEHDRELMGEGPYARSEIGGGKQKWSEGDL